MSIRKWEALLEKHIEGFFNKKFASALEYAEIEKYLEREMQLKRKKIGTETYLPNSYFFYINEEDYQSLQPSTIQEQLYARAVCFAIGQNCLIDETLTLVFQRDAGLARGCCEVKSFYQFPEPVEVNREDTAAHTIVLEKPVLPAVAAEHKTASLSVVQGPDEGSYLALSERRLHIGRRAENEFLLTDPKASRLHAYIAFEKYRHMLYDAGSTNGTYVNGEKIKEHRLCYGDEIRIGNTVLLYEVI